MVLLQIAEPGAEVSQSRTRKIAVGIDLGTTNSLVAHFDGASLQVLSGPEGDVSVPSVVNYSGDTPLVGAGALALSTSHHHDTIASAKRFMGKSVEDTRAVSDHLRFSVQKALAFETSKGPKTPVEVSADILTHLRSRAESTLENGIDGAVITVPAYFDDAQRQATRQAAELAGLRVLRLLNEPTAAAVAYGLDDQEEGLVAVYDLGGGTFDISILRLHAGVFEVLATGGDSALGGDDIDHALADALAQKLVLGTVDAQERRALLVAARALKEALSTEESATIVIPIRAVDESLTVRRDELEALAEPLVQKTLESCKNCLRDAAVVEVDRVVLVGGSTRMPLVKRSVAELFGREPLCSIDPDQVVAMGAARQADILVGNRSDDDVLLLDVTPLSLGVETYGGLVERIIPRNTTIPVARAQEFTTAKDGQTGLLVHVVQGERERVEDCRSLARFELKGIPAMVAGAARIQVSFQVDADGLLEVSAREQTTGHEAHVVVKPSYGLADDEVATMLRASYEHAAEDMQARQLAEARVEAESLLDGTQTAIQVDGELLDSAERARILQLATALQDTMAAGDAAAIRTAIEALGGASEDFAARRMDKSIREALGGMALTELEQEETL
jgi:molecular chaperone HscA